MSTNRTNNKEAWWKDAVIYEVYVDKFSDTFNGLSQKLDYLNFLGVNCIHLLPFYPSPMIDDGYDVIDYVGIRENLGTIKDFKKFIKNAHNMGIKVIIDFVLNHTSTQHPWFKKACSSVKNNKRDFYLWDKTGVGYAGLSNIFFDLKDRNWIYNEPTGDHYFSTFYSEQADLNWNNPLVFTEMMRVLDFWVNIGVDGFRLDAAAHLIKKEGTMSESLPETHALIKKIRSYLDQNYNNIILLAEVNDSVEKIKEYFSTGDECHMAYNFPLAAKILLAIKRNNLTLIQKIIDESLNIPENCSWAVFMEHHDEISLTTLTEKEREEVLEYFDPEKKYRFGKGLSMRLANIFDGNNQKVIEVFKTLFNIAGSHIIYYGNEIGVKNELLALGEKDTRRGLRPKFDWEIAYSQKSDEKSLLTNISNIIKK